MRDRSLDGAFSPQQADLVCGRGRIAPIADKDMEIQHVQQIFISL